MKKLEKPTYISLFSSAGVGCYGFSLAGFDCIATNEIIERRLNVQKNNNKCKFESGYICGDITLEQTKIKIYEEISKWEKMGLDKVDLVVATPPCQGMSVANHKKTKTEITRNSLVVESINLIKKIRPNFFIFENVSSFMKTGCTTFDNQIKKIGDVIYDELGMFYSISYKILNFKNYGSYSSRTRTLVIGVSKSFADYISPIELFPTFRKEQTLRNVIGNMKKLEWGEFDDNDFYHQFRTYNLEMRNWIHDIREGQSAFDNEDPIKRPHQVIDGKIVPNVQKNGDKYTRQIWDKVAPCIHTRNDQLASQNTIHPEQDRVFSIRELMKMMSIPDTFKWIDKDLIQLNALTLENKKKLLKKEEINIRQSIGEAVPTSIFYQIGTQINRFLHLSHINNTMVIKVIKKYSLEDFENLKKFLINNPLSFDLASLSRIAELSNCNRESNSAYFTNKAIVNEIISKLPNSSNNSIDILEPSVGIGNFLPLLIKKYEDKNVIFDICDIDSNSLEIVKILLSKISIPSNIHINYICDDFLLHIFKKKYFLVVGNPPFTKINSLVAEKYMKNNLNKQTRNLFEFFLEKSLKISNYVSLIMPKNILNTSEFEITRDLLSKYRIDCIEDFGELGFKGVLVETVCLFIDTHSNPFFTEVISIPKNIRLLQKQSYIVDKSMPYWIIYRDNYFDEMVKKMTFDLFTVFRDRQLTSNNTYFVSKGNDVKVIKSRNIDDLGQKLIPITGYDSYVDKDTINQVSVGQFLDNDQVYLTPNMTYKPRVIKKEKGYVVNGSVAILIPKDKSSQLSKDDMIYYSTNEYRKFYSIARNFQTRSLNIDNSSVYWFGKIKKELQ